MRRKKSKRPSKKQATSRNKNFEIFRIRGMIANLENMEHDLSDYEKQVAINAIGWLNSLINCIKRKKI